MLSAYARVEVPEIINKSHSSGRSKTLQLCMSKKRDFLRFPHLHTIKLCSEPLRRMKMSRKTYERVCVVLTNKDRK